MQENERLRLLGAVAAHAYLIEFLLGILMRHQPKDPAEPMEALRSAIRRQIEADKELPPTDAPYPDHKAIQDAAMIQLDEMMDRVLTQLYNPGPE